MFSKIFKHDFKYVFRFWWIFAAATVILSCGGGMIIRGMVELSAQNIDNVLFSFLSVLGIFTVVMALCLFPMVSVIVSLVRYYKNFYSDEGYLTFTLPVKRSSLLNSKILMYLLFEVMSLLVLLLDIYLMLVIGVDGLHRELVRHLPILLEELQAVWSPYLTADLILAPFFFLAAALMGINLYYLCFTFGSVITRRHKVLASIGIYYGTSMVLSFIQQIISFFTMDSLLNQSITYAEFGDASAPFTLFLLLSTVLYAGIAISTYCINLYCIKNKLNLN